MALLRIGLGSMKTSKLQIIIITIIFPAGLLYGYLHERNLSFSDIFLPGTPVLHIAEIPVRVEIAETEAERVRGLSDRESLGNVDGLLFIFPEASRHAIWMKDMRFPIDIIWVSQDLKVVSINENATPNSYPAVFRPTEDARYAIETNVHFADTFGIKVGQSVRLPAAYINQ